jgi:hypothetical protein
MNMNVWTFSLCRSSLHHVFTHCLLLSSPVVSLERNYFFFFPIMLRNFDKCCTPAPTIWTLWVRYYKLLSVALWVKETTISAFNIILKSSCLVKENNFSVCCYCVFVLVVLQVPTLTWEDVTLHSQWQRHFRDQSVEA